MTQQYIPNLGEPPAVDARRDAVHMAVAPVVAAHRIRPGAWVGFLEDGTMSALAKELIGVVDPFINGPVHPGERFWLFVKPNTVTSLRHVWQHPAFKAKAPGNE